jgi:N6-L-threonylcarbamoyladenine synthase
LGKKEFLILSIETSCDETAAAVVANGRQVLSNIIASQISVHQRFGGVVPEIASRKHMENIIPVLQQALDQAEVALEELDAVAVTYGPGLVGALLVGVAQAKAMAYALKIPLIGVHHLLGHIYANLLEKPDLKLPAVCLVVSGGHTSLIHWKSHGELEILGATRDDAAGEAYDKIARVLGLGYPGGPALEKAALSGDKEAIDFPRAWLAEDSLDFSFSGLKSSVINYVHNARQKGISISVPDVAASFQEAVVDVLVTKTIKAAQALGVKTVLLAGGVAANRRLREAFACRGKDLELSWPRPHYCTDNAAMIGCAAYYLHLAGKHKGLDLNAVPSLPLEEAWE